MLFPVSTTGKQFILALCVACLLGCGGSPQSYVDRGNQFAELHKYDDAALQYRKAIQKAPNLGEAHYRLGLMELKRSQPLPAYRELARAVELMPGNDEALFRLGQLALSIYNGDPQHPRQQYDQAAKAAERLLNKKPDGFDGNFIKGAIAFFDNNPADAVLFLRKAVRAKPDDFNAQLGLARALVQDNQAPAGLSLAQELIRKNQAFGPAYDFIYQQYQTSGQKDEAENVLKLKVANNPKVAAFVVELARHYAAQQKPPEVDATIARLVSDPADFPDGRLTAGEFYLSVGKPDLAIQEFNAGLASAATNRIAYRKGLAPILASQKKWPEAYEQMEAILKEQPSDQEVRLMRALAWLDEGKPENLDRAIAELQAQSKSRPNNPALHFQAGNALARKADRDGARREWMAAAQANRNYLPARFALARLYLAEGRDQEALRVSDEIVAVAPRDGQASLLHASCLTAAGQYRRARIELDGLVSQFPKSPQVRFRLGVLDIAERRYKEAEDIFRQIGKDLSNDPQVLAGLAEAFQGENQGAKAIQLLQDELKRNPNSPVLRQVLARIARASRNYDVVVDQYTQLAAAQPGSTTLQLSLAAAYTAKGDTVSALGVLQKVVQADPKSVPASLMLAQALLSKGRVDEAKARYRRVLEMQPDNANALNDLAYLMADSSENLDQALAYAQRGLQHTVEPGLKTSLTDTLGWIYLKRNMTDSALRTFQTLVTSNPGNATFRYHLGTALFQKGDKKEARVELEAALAAKPSAADEPKIRELLARR